ncbi:alpha/beta fold hydrolase [Peribacillus butanolivorans]|uniref:alpha/beta fold hydrolase n=1 Tax=Peribacillus butanolivorans TaxID=421767 RepID=UPI00362F587E
MSEQTIKVNGITIFTESFGNVNDPAILLMMGATASMVWWEEDFCQRLADRGLYVIRYDSRDVGRSTTYPPGNPEYSFEDLADDAIHVLDSYGIEQAHIVGMSMGGMLTQMIALRHPERVLTVTLIATSNFAPELPPMEDKVTKFFGQAGAIDWTNDQSIIEFIVGKWRIISGSRHTFDEQRVHRLAIEEIRRSNNIASMNNHGLISGGESYLTRTKEITVPTLIIHGTEDPIIPYEHGKMLASLITDADLFTLNGTGHELHYNDWDELIDVITKHTLQLF